MQDKFDRHAHRLRFKGQDGRKRLRIVAIEAKVKASQRVQDSEFREQISEIYTQE